MRFFILTIALVMFGILLNANGEPVVKKAVEQNTIEVKVLVLNFDPLIPKEGNKRLHEVCKYNDPHELAKGYIDDLKEASRGLVIYKIVEWKDIDTFHTKTDGFTYTADEYMKCFKEKKGWHDPDGADYEKTFEDYKVLPMIDSGKVDEVWFFGAPYFGYWESSMAGPGAFYINGGVFENVKSKRAFVIMGFNYERGVAEMLHDLCHRTESTMSRVYGGWEVDKLTTNWAKFAANNIQSKGIASVGTCHYPANAEDGYDYSNPREVESDADDWLNYPNLTGKKKKVSREDWGGPEYHRNYMKWFYTRLPHAPGVNEDGRLNNWWEYIFNFNNYDEKGKPKK
jgi:hypothetical protein